MPKKLIFLFLCIISFSLLGQEKIKIIKEKNLTYVEESNVYHFRLEKTGQILDLWSDDLINFESQLTSYYWNINKKGEVKRYYKSIEKLDNSKSKEIFNLINKFSLNKLDKDWNPNITDEEEYDFSFKEQGKITHLTFSDIDNQDNIKEVDAVRDFLNDLNKIIDWEKSYSKLKQKLPQGEYYNGDMLKLIKK